LGFPVLDPLWRRITVPIREKRRWQHRRAEKTTRQVREEIKRNRKPKRPRHRNWVPHDLDDPDALEDPGFPQGERIMPRGERERRRAIMAEALATLEEETSDAKASSLEEEIPERQGIVVEVSSSLCRVDLDEHSRLCGLRGSLSAQDTGFTNVVAVGDRVIVSEDGGDRGVVEAVLPRQSALARPDPFYGHLQQVIVANVNQLLVVASWRDPALWFELVDRYLITAERNRLQPIVCVNKIDLAGDVADCRAALRPYLDLGYRVLFTSALSGEGVDGLRAALRGKTTVLAGMSGVGKSSLLMAVQPGLELYTREVGDHSRAGRHATTQVSMLRLAGGSFVVDTPGIREFGLSGLRQVELVRFYPEMAALEGRCQFGDCSHTHEPDCAIKAAVHQGHVSKTRYHSYTRIRRSLPA
jgi:ribosome biogenesis GTPase